MTRGRYKRLVVVLATLMLLLSSVFSGAAVAQRGGGGDPTGEFVCESIWTGQFRLVSQPTDCQSHEQFIDVAESMPFDYCVSVYTGIMTDDRAGDLCPRGTTYVNVEDQTSFFVCVNPFTRLLYHMDSPDSPCAGSTTFFTDFRGDITKFACVEENLNPEACDFFPAGPHNEIRQIGPMPNTSGGFFDIQWQWVFDGNNSTTQRCSLHCDNASIEAALESLPGINDVAVTGGPIAGTNDAPIRIEFVGVDAQTDIIPQISIQSVANTVNQSDTTIVDGAVNGPAVSYVIPGGTVQIFEAPAGTDPNNPATYGPEVTNGPQPVNAAGSFTATNLFEGDYVVCATGANSVALDCEIVTVFDNSQTIVNNIDMFGVIMAEITDTVGTNEVQFIRQCSFGCEVTGGTFTITVDGETTANLAADATMAEVKAALEALPSIDLVDVTGEDFALGFNPGNEMQIEFQGALAGQDVPELTLTLALTGSGFGLFYEKGTVTQGSGEVHTLTLDDRVSGGTFTLTYDNGVTSSTTGPIAWNATVDDVEVALNALASINSGGGSVTVSSTNPIFPPEDTPITNGPFEVNFSGVAGADTNVLIVDNTNLE